MYNYRYYRYIVIVYNDNYCNVSLKNGCDTRMINNNHKYYDKRLNHLFYGKNRNIPCIGIGFKSFGKYIIITMNFYSHMSSIFVWYDDHLKVNYNFAANDEFKEK